MKKIILKGLAVVAAVIVLAIVAVPAADAAYERDLTVGASGSDVAELQAFLVSKGFLVMPAGVTPGYFGTLTQVALGKYQAANGIAPAAGYFGPMTRAKVAAEINIQIIEVKNATTSSKTTENKTTSQKKSSTFSINDEDDSYESFKADDVGEGDVGHFVINFNVTAGDEDIYVGGAIPEFSNFLAGFSTTTSFTGPTSKKQSNGNYKVSSNKTEEFTLIVELEADPSTANTPQSMMLSEILWNTDNSDSDYNSYTSRLDRYETKTLFLRGL